MLSPIILDSTSPTFDDDSSTSGFLLPTALLLGADLRPTPVSSPAIVVEPPEVACFFTGDDANVIEWVLAGRAAAGAVDNLTWTALIPRSVSYSWPPPTGPRSSTRPF